MVTPFAPLKVLKKETTRSRNVSHNKDLQPLWLGCNNASTSQNVKDAKVYRESDVD